MIGDIETGDADVLLVIAVQNDFCAGGALAIPEDAVRCGFRALC